VTIINKMLFRGPLEGAKVPFTDVEEGYWAYGHILESSIDHYYVRNKDQSETISKTRTVNKERQTEENGVGAIFRKIQLKILKYSLLKINL